MKKPINAKSMKAEITNIKVIGSTHLESYPKSTAPETATPPTHQID